MSLDFSQLDEIKRRSEWARPKAHLPNEAGLRALVYCAMGLMAYEFTHAFYPNWMVQGVVALGAAFAVARFDSSQEWKGYFKAYRANMLAVTGQKDDSPDRQ